MNWLIIIGLICCVFTTGKAITCSQCTEITSTNDVALNLTGADLPTCSGTLSEVECPEDVTSCMTMVINIYLSHESDRETITLTQKQRQCSPDISFIPSGDICLEEATVDAITANLPDPATLLPPNLNVTAMDSSASICVCDSFDSCTPPSPVATSEPAPENAITCKSCTEISSHDDDVTIPEDSHIASCLSDPAEMACPAGVLRCMTLVVHSSFTRQSGPDVVLRKKQRGCLPLAAAGFIPPGDVCLDKALVDLYLSANDSLARISTGGGLTFDRIVNASFCICDSANNCTPPSPPTVGETGPDAEGNDSSMTRNIPGSRALNLRASFAVNVVLLLCVVICMVNAYI